MSKYVSVIIDTSSAKLEKTFTYLVKDSMEDQLDIGSIVTIPFGNANRQMYGYVIDFIDEIDFDESKLKYITEVRNDVNIESNLIKLAWFMRTRYACSIQSALKMMIPSKESIKKKYKNRIVRKASLEIIAQSIEKIENQKRFESRKKALEYLLTHETVTEEAFKKSLGISTTIINTLHKNKIIDVIRDEVNRIPYNLDERVKTTKITPNKEQQEAIKAVNESVKNEKNDVFLLKGITGSGKTEVYMQIIETVLERGQQAIVLIPEIGLTPQTVSRFVGRFGEQVGVMHSRLSQGEKYDQWQLAKEGKISIMIGPRSAIFAPFNQIGVIIIDEEHEMTYKSETHPKYHAREIAIKRGSMSKCPVVLGTATPLIETYYKALNGKYKLLQLNNKAVRGANLDVQLIDMREEMNKGNISIFSQSLKEAINEALKQGNQVLLFINRRGHSKFISCRKCGYVSKCDSCDIAYTYHSENQRLICHYCGKSIKMIHRCPECGSTYIKSFGVGTQKVEKLVKEAFKGARTLRMDFDTTSLKNAHEKIINQFENHEADILIGTQMIAKGHHFKNVTVVGVIAADLSLYVDDFRAGERTFQLVTQVTGRTGRSDKSGTAYIQTYTPEHFCLISAMKQDYDLFYKEEIQFRKMMWYPPFSNILIVIISSQQESTLEKRAHLVKHIIDSQFEKTRFEILGPAKANISKMNDIYRYKIIIKSNEYKLLITMVNHLVKSKDFYDELKNIGIQYDINPMKSY
jgi:primosomal protein N' (replication factor Y)